MVDARMAVAEPLDPFAGSAGERRTIPGTRKKSNSPESPQFYSLYGPPGKGKYGGHVAACFLDDNSDVREIIINDDYILAIAPQHKKIWLHEKESGVNFLLPVTNFYNELMRVCNIRDTKIALRPASFFEIHNQFTDDQLILAFFSYNKYLKRVNIDYTLLDKIHHKKRKSILLVFSGKGRK